MFIEPGEASDSSSSSSLEKKGKLAVLTEHWRLTFELNSTSCMQAIEGKVQQLLDAVIDTGKNHELQVTQWLHSVQQKPSSTI